MTHFNWWIDGSIIALYLVATMVVGIMVRKYVGKVEHFLVAGREVDLVTGTIYLASISTMLVACCYYWQTPNNAMVSLVRGTAWDQEWAVRELYAMLLHSTATHLPAEFGTIPWSTRGYTHPVNITPQCTSSANTIQLLRNMLVREQGNDLHLLSAISPEWVRPDRQLHVRDEPSSFGPISFDVKAGTDRITIRLPEKYRNQPSRLVVRVPWFYAVERATLDGKPISLKDGHVVVPLTGRELVLAGDVKPDSPRLRYDQAVADYKAEYRRRYQEFLRTGLK